MSAFGSGFCSHFALRLAFTGITAGMLAGCANSERLGDVFANPFESAAQSPVPAPADPGLGGNAATPAPVGQVQSQPLSAPLPSRTALPKPGPGYAAAAAPASGRTFAGWSAEGGSPVVVAQGENAEVLSRRYGVPVDALVRTNGFTSASEVQPGTRVVVPVYNAALAASSGAHTPARTEPVVESPRPTKTKTAALENAPVPPPPPAHPTRADKAGKPAEISAKKQAEARAESKTETKAAARHKPVDAGASVTKEASKAAVPSAKKEAVKVASVAPKQEPVTAEAKKTSPATKHETAKAPKAETGAAETKKPSEEAPQSAVAEGTRSAAENGPEFRWPARGRIIQGFKPGGNDGINIAVPEGTSVKAAEGGVVAYAGNELKGYGNLVLIRHPNGFVTAYANNGDLEVKRGDTVKRGQVIAKSGQSGNVASPQLHFELRKGSTPVDPTQYLAGL